MFISKKKIKFNNNLYDLLVDTYSNGRMRIYIKNKKECLDITIDIPDHFAITGNVFFNPDIMSTNVLKEIKKAKLINKFVGIVSYNGLDVPIAIVNMGKLRDFDSVGVNAHLNKVSGEFNA